jgi:3-deoxy-manno-octulosonate cytidylyltransferase (CMP-KDO synthetase)
MPDVDVAMIQQVQWHLQHYSVTTAFTEMPKEQQDDPNTVKMIKAGDQALWFGRGITGYGDWHLGIYGYRRNALEMYSTLAEYEEEHIEQLEQLRWLKNGWQVGCLSVQYNGVEINAPEDVDQWHINNKRSQ